MNFNIEESYDKGKIIVSMKDLLPGSVLFEEDRPLMFLNREYILKFESTGSTGLHLGIYNTYRRRLMPRARYKYMQLFGPTEGAFADELREQAKQLTTWDQGEQRNFNDKEVDKFVKVVSIWHYNAVSMNSGSTLAVFETLSRMSHSCAPNCAVEFVGMRCVCRVIQPVKGAEELTVAYDPSHQLKPAQERMRLCQELHGFICHCSRCECPVDDTRRFPCLDPTCKGTQFMCQACMPKSADVGDADCPPAEDHLLPCSDCGTQGTVQQTLTALTLEKKLILFTAELDRDLEDKFDAFSEEDCLCLLKGIDHQPCPPGHALSGPVLRCRWRVSVYLSRINTNTVELLQSAQRFVHWLGTVYRFPSAELLSELTAVAASLVESDTHENAVFAREVCLRALRLSLLLRGREDGRMELDRMLSVLQLRAPAALVGPAAADCDNNSGITAAHPLQLSASKCGYCEEFPCNAYMALKRCARCKVAHYCSAACQKAHWKTHKPCCSALGATA